MTWRACVNSKSMLFHVTRNLLEMRAWVQRRKNSRGAALPLTVHSCCFPGICADIQAVTK